jgi:hypothetical protein
MPEYKPVPVDVARQIAEQCGKSMVVILSYDPAHQLTHTTTYGVEPSEKEMAADVGDRCAKLICGDGFDKSRRYEDFRFADQAARTKAIEQLIKAATAADHALGSILAVRDGITDEVLQTVRSALAEAIELGKKSPIVKTKERR